MAFERPSLATLVTRVEGDLKSGLGLVTILRRSFLGVVARVLAGLAHSLFGYLKFIEGQAFPDTATDEYLERWAAIWGVTRVEATFGEFTATVTGTNGTVIPAGTVYRRTDGTEYTTDAEVTIASGTGTIALTASVAGEASEVAVSDTIGILSPIAGLNANATVAAITTEPEDAEDDESLQARLIDRIQQPPSGGAANDYIQWALEVAGITRAWVAPQALGPGTVLVYIVSDDEDPITPSAPKIAEVQAYIDAIKPVTASVTVVAANLLEVDITIAMDPNTTDVQEAVEAELEDLFLRDSQVAGAFAAPGETHTGKILVSRINEAISIGAGEEDHEIIEINGDVTPQNIEPTDGYLATLGTITWQALA
jgi:uncharacterized phage protein gp47/JayE